MEYPHHPAAANSDAAMSSRGACDRVLNVAFALALATPGLWMLARGGSPAILEAENRTAAPLPERPHDWKSAVDYPAAFSAWWDEALGGRDELLRARSMLEWFVFQRSPATLFLRGKREWVFFTGDDSRACWRGLRTLPEKRLDAWCRALEARRDALRSIGIEFLYAIVPSKQTIYPEYLPDSDTRSGSTPLEQLLPWLAAHCDAPVLDLRQALLDEKAHDRPEIGDFAFHRLGTHWSSRGAWAAVRAIVEKLAERFPKMRPPERSEYECILRPEPDQDDQMPVRLRLEGCISEPSYEFAPKAGARARITQSAGGSPPHFMEFECDREGGEVMFLDHDSFGPEFRPHLAEHASRLVAVWRYSLPVEEIVLAHPRIVVQALTERFLINDPIGAGVIALPLERSRFDALPPFRKDLDAAAMLRAIEPRGGTKTRLEDSDGTTDLWIRTEGEECVALPEFAVPAGMRLALRVVLTSPKRGAMSLWFRHRGDGRYDHQNRAAVEVREGLDDVCFVIPVDDLVGRLLLRPGMEPGAYRLHALEARLIRK
jgi:hypothetical protein